MQLTAKRQEAVPSLSGGRGSNDPRLQEMLDEHFRVGVKTRKTARRHSQGTEQAEQPWLRAEWRPGERHRRAPAQPRGSVRRSPSNAAAKWKTARADGSPVVAAQPVRSRQAQRRTNCAIGLARTAIETFSTASSTTSTLPSASKSRNLRRMTKPNNRHHKSEDHILPLRSSKTVPRLRMR